MITFNYFLGIYVPLTREGNIVVDGVLASCYGSFDHDLAHISMKPVQWFPETMEWIFGLDDVSPVYVNIAEHFGRLILPYCQLFNRTFQ